MYTWIIRPLLFLVNPERIHYFTFGCIRFASLIPGMQLLLKRLFSFDHPKLETRILGLTFPNPVGLAAGFDKDALVIDELACFGFGFIEIGTLTPKPQSGNDKPRLFRLTGDRALINRMGFNNRGVLHAVELLKKRKSKVIVGGNIGKNKITPNDEAVEDYRYCVHALYPYVDYFVVNVSSPNTPGLRELQEKAPLKNLLTEVKALSLAEGGSKPVLLKIAPDLSVEQLDDIIEILKETETDGVIATNTTISREGLKTEKRKVDRIGAGGLSGRPLTKHSTEVIRYLRKEMGPTYPIIGVGGIMSPEDAMEKIKAGANLVQVYTGFIYEGPAFARRICKTIAAETR